MPNEILKLFEGLDIALFTPFQFFYDEEYMAAVDITVDVRVKKILTCEKIKEDRREAFLQQTKLGWTRIFIGYLTSEW